VEILNLTNEGVVMKIIFLKKYVCVSALLLLMGTSANAATLWVNCGARSGLTSINAALKSLQSADTHVPATINVSGACNERIVIQSMDHLTLNALNGASISDTSSGTLDVIDVNDSSEVTIAGFTINGGSIGIGCGDGSLCRLTKDIVQNAGLGIGVFTLTRARLTGVTLLNNGTGLLVNHGGAVLGDATMRGNGIGLDMLAGGVAYFVGANITQSQTFGIRERVNATLDCLSCVITGNTGVGVTLQEGSSAKLADYTITNNGGPGVELSGLASALFRGGTISGNSGGTDVLCGTPFTSARGATFNIGDGVTNCVEPTP
jgi:Right handed beta helix region